MGNFCLEDDCSTVRLRYSRAMRTWVRRGMIAVVALAWALRLYAIARQDVWGDEAFSIWLSSQPLPRVVAGGADTHPPLYPLLLFVWLRGAGHSVFAVRALSALVGLLLVPLLYALGKRLSSPPVGLAAALLATFSPGLIYYAQETRMYSLAAVLGAASLLAALRLLQGRDGLRDWGFFALTALAALYTHYDTAFLVAAEGAVLLVVRRQRWKALVLSAIAVGLAYLPWVLVQRAFLADKAQARLQVLRPGTLAAMVRSTAALLLDGERLSVVPAAALLLLVAAGAAALWRRKEALWLCLAALTLPFLLAWLVNPLMPFFYPRYLLFVAAPLFLIAAAAVAAASPVMRGVAAVAVLSLLPAMFSADLRYYRGEAMVRGRYGEMMAYVEREARPGDALLLANPLQAAIFDYYRPARPEAFFLPRLTAIDDETEALLTGYAERYQRLWLVRYGNPAEYDPDDELVRWLAEHGTLAYHGGWLDAELYLFVMGGEGGPQVSVDDRFGTSIHLRGYTIGATHLRGGDLLTLTLFWTTDAPLEQRYTVYTHLLAPDGHLVAQMDGEPQGGAAPTDRWQPGEIIRDGYAIRVPESAPPGRYTVRVGLYLLQSGERLPVFDAAGKPLGDGVSLGVVEIGE